MRYKQKLIIINGGINMKDKKYLLDMITCLIDVAANELVPFSIFIISLIENGTIIKPIYERDLSHHALNHIFPFKQLINVGYREKHPCYNMENILDDFYNKIKLFIKDQKVTILDENVDLKDSGDIFIEIIGDIILDSSEIKYLKNFLIDGFLKASMGYYNFINNKK